MKRLTLKQEFELLALAVRHHNLEYHSDECWHCGTRFDSDGVNWPACPNCHTVPRTWLANTGIDWQNPAMDEQPEILPDCAGDLVDEYPDDM